MDIGLLAIVCMHLTCHKHNAIGLRIMISHNITNRSGLKLQLCIVNALFVLYSIHDFTSLASSAATQGVRLITSPVQTSFEFAAVVSDIAEQLNCACTASKLQKIKTFCSHTTDEDNIPLFSPTEICNIMASKSIFDIFYVIHPHWNWHSHHLLPVIIKKVGSSTALELLKKFEAKIKYNEKLKDLNENFSKWRKPLPPNYYKMVAIVDKNYDQIVLQDCMEIDDFIADCLSQYDSEYSKHNYRVQTHQVQYG